MEAFVISPTRMTEIREDIVSGRSCASDHALRARVSFDELAALVRNLDTLEAEVARLREELTRAKFYNSEPSEVQIRRQRDDWPDRQASAPVSRLQAGEDVVERAQKAIKNWCLLHSAYIFTEEKARELAETIALAVGSTDRERGLEEARKALEAIEYECGSMSDERFRGVVKAIAKAGLVRSQEG